MTAVAGKDVLHLGCGTSRRADAVNVDVTPRTNPDVVHDLNVRPWPFADDRFGAVFARDVVEHLEDTIATLEEIHRVCRHGGLVDLVVPHFSSSGAFTDPTHRRFFSRFTFDYFTGEHPLSFYSTARFRQHHAQIHFHPRLTNALVWRLANRFPRRYEERWAWIFPAWFLHVQLEVIKTGASSITAPTGTPAG